VARLGLPALLATALLVPHGVAAQRGGTVELGGFGRYTIFDKSLSLDNAVGGGGRLGVFLAPWVSLEGDGSFTKANGPNGASTSYLPIHGRLLFHIPLAERVAILLGAGYARTEYGDAADATDDGATGLAGVRVGLSRTVAIRLDAATDYIPSPANAQKDNWNTGVHVGLSLLLGKTGPQDADLDGVVDRLDQCPNTPSGEQVNSMGCPLDGDQDGVPDSRDRCPGTVRGERVDGEGCPVDNDRDGVPDSRDRCPGTPTGERVDAAGCALDSDRDTVPDSRDRCANTPVGEQVDAEGCPLDADRDGVPDSRDRCPGTTAGEPVDADGCPLPKDADGDGVTDDRDRCPNTEAGTQVDAVGCAILFGRGTTLVLEGVTFATGRADLSDAARAILLTVAQSLAARPGIQVEVAGHTDNTGSRAGNLRLSQARADAVREFLVRNGVPAEQLTARGYGPDQPVATNASAAGRQQNRRVELRRLN